MEVTAGIENDEFELTDSFVDFEYYQSGPMRNLQIMFIVLFVLVALPVVLVIFKGLFFFSTKIQSCINTTLDKLFFNIYIRFTLEAYMELALSSLIRFKNYTFTTTSEKFHTILSTSIFAVIVAFLVFSLVFPQVNQAKLSSESAQKRYGDLYLGLKTR